MEFKEELETNVKKVEDIISEYKPREDGFQQTVLEAMNYSFLAGGKRLRPLMMKKTYEAFGGEHRIVEPFMAALEMIHTYSLIHDDLPEMDNDDLRRGKPTNHVKYGQAMAVLAGDGLLNYAYETALKATKFAVNDEELKRIVRALKMLADRAGVYGMVGGQAVDVEAEKKGILLSKEQLLFTYENKTAALIQAALMIGAVLAGASDQDITTLRRIGYNVGIAFQLQDDILDITSTEEVLGKPIGSDERNGKVTYVSFLGIEDAVKEQKRLSDEAAEKLLSLKKGKINDKYFDFLHKLILALVDRKV